MMDNLIQSSNISFELLPPPSEPTSTHAPSSHHTQTPTRRGERRAWPRHKHASAPHTQLFILLIFFTCCVSFSSASHFFIDERMVETREAESLESTFARLARSGTILVDKSPPPMGAGEWNSDPFPRAMDEDLKRRGASSSAASTATTTLRTSTSSATASTTSSSIAAAETTSTSTLPVPFDIGFSGNITSNCQSFMDSMLSNSTFKTCLPFSLLLQNSNSMFQTEKSLVRITQLLDYSCAANLTTCSRLMSSFASNITTTSACAADLASQNPMIQQAKLGLLAYKPLYSASCLRNPTTTAYCFADAITNTNSSADVYVYYLPLNISLVGGSQPTCTSCLKNTMNVFEAATSDRSSALASDYPAAAAQVNVNCGPSFVNASLAAAVTSGATASMTGPTNFHAGLFTIMLLLATWIL